MIAELALVLALVTAHPVIYEGHLKNRSAVVHYSGTHFYVVYITEIAPGIRVDEVVVVDAKTFEEEVVYLSEQVMI